MKKKIIHIVSADADPALLRSVAALHAAERQLGADSELWTTAVVGGAPHQTHLSVAGRDWRGRIATGHAPAWFRRLWAPQERAEAPLPRLETPCGLAERVRKAGADLVHLHALRGELASAEELAQIPGRLFWSVADTDYLGEESGNAPRDQLARRLFPFLQGREILPLAATPALAEKMRSSLLFQGRRSEIVPPTVDPATFHPDPVRRNRCRRALGAAESTFIVMMEGKSVTSFAAEVLTNLGKALSGDLLLLTKGSPARPVNCRTACCTDAGGFSRALADCCRAADLWLGTEGDPERLPIPLLEAAACGTPALLPEGETAKNLITPEWNGLLAPCGRSAEWVQAALAIQADPEGYGAAACEQVYTSYSPLNAARQLLAL